MGSMKSRGWLAALPRQSEFRGGRRTGHGCRCAGVHPEVPCLVPEWRRPLRPDVDRLWHAGRAGVVLRGPRWTHSSKVERCALDRRSRTLRERVAASQCQLGGTSNVPGEADEVDLNRSRRDNIRDCRLRVASNWCRSTARNDAAELAGHPRS